MSSLVRRLAIRIMKRARYTREKWIIGRDPSGKPKIIEVKRGGEITDPDDNPVGRRWPPLVPARIKAQARPQKRAFPGADRQGRVPHSLRRSKTTIKWLTERAERRAVPKAGEQ